MAPRPLKALLVDSWYDQYLGVVILVRVKDGRIKRGQRVRMMAKGVGAPGRAGGRVQPEDDPGR